MRTLEKQYWVNIDPLCGPIINNKQRNDIDVRDAKNKDARVFYLSQAIPSVDYVGQQNRIYIREYDRDYAIEITVADWIYNGWHNCISGMFDWLLENVEDLPDSITTAIASLDLTPRDKQRRVIKTPSK